LTNNVIVRQPAIKSGLNTIIKHRSFHIVAFLRAPQEVQSSSTSEPKSKSTKSSTMAKKTVTKKSGSKPTKSKKKKSASASAGKPKKARKKKVQKKPLKREVHPPKRPPSNGFAYYLRSQIGKVSSVEDAKMGVIQLAEDWKTLPDAEKQRYSAQATEIYQAYRKELEEFEANLTPEQRLAENDHRKRLNKRRAKTAKSKVALVKDPSTVKYLNPYMLFAQHCWKTEGPFDQTVVEYTKSLGQRWRNLPEDQKAKFVQQSERTKPHA